MFPCTAGVDLFPCCVDIQGIVSTHVETVCLLSKLHEAKHHVNVAVDMDWTAAENKATYEEIKKYVADNNGGMKVTNLYIAQVKAKYGIIERENYNLPKSGIRSNHSVRRRKKLRLWKLSRLLR